MAPRISKNKQDEIVQLYDDGVRIRDIAQQVGVGAASVFVVLERLGKKPNRLPRANGEDQVSVDQVFERMLAAEREQGRLAAENRRLRALLAESKSK